jgi:hypothetical protein
LLDFVLSEDTSEEAIAMFLVGLSYTLDLDNIDAYCDIHSLREMKCSWQTSHSCRSEEPIGNRLSRPVH